MGAYTLVKDLPKPVRDGLDSIGYGRKDIKVDVKSDVQLSGSAGGGRRSFVVLVNLDTGRHETLFGSWGGQNMFDRTNPVDNDTRTHRIPPNGVAIVGTMGGGQPVWAHIYGPDSVMPKIITAGKVELSDSERDVLGAFATFTSSYRKEWLARKGIAPSVIDGLVSRDLLKRSRNGATQITTDGKNAVGNHRVD